jgi:hypothetical protein
MVVIRILSFIFLVAGIILVGAGLFVYQDTRDFLSRARSGAGTVTGVSRRTVWHRFSSTVYDYTVRYVPGEGATDEFFTSRGHNSPDYAVGQVVAILYTGDIPHRVAINDFSVLWSSFGLLGILGGCLLGSGVCNLWITAIPARTKIRTAVTVRELKEAFRAGRLTRGSEYQGLLVALSFVGFALVGVILAVIVFAPSTLKVIIAVIVLYVVAQIVRGRRTRQHDRA